MDDSMFVGDSTAYSRRSFLKGVGATAGFTLLAGVGLGATGCATQEDGANLAETGHTVVTPQGTYEVYETDMLVCGCGYAGMSAAANAAKSGLNVTVVEKGPFGSGGVAGMNFDFLTTWIYDPGMGDTASGSGKVKTFGLPSASAMKLTDTNTMFSLKKETDKAIQVHIWMEGTDPACTDSLKSADYAIRLRFTGTTEDNKPFSENS